MEADEKCIPLQEALEGSKEIQRKDVYLLTAEALESLKVEQLVWCTPAAQYLIHEIRQYQFHVNILGDSLDEEFAWECLETLNHFANNTQIVLNDLDNIYLSPISPHRSKHF
jgi:hypothetical protein